MKPRRFDRVIPSTADEAGVPLMPFLEAPIRCIARSHLFSGIFERSMNGTDRYRELFDGIRCIDRGRDDALFPFRLVQSCAGSALPQCGQIGPFGQR